MQADAASAAVVVATAALGQLGDDDDVRARRGAFLDRRGHKEVALIKDFILLYCVYAYGLF